MGERKLGDHHCLHLLWFTVFTEVRRFSQTLLNPLAPSHVLPSLWQEQRASDLQEANEKLTEECRAVREEAAAQVGPPPRPCALCAFLSDSYFGGEGPLPSSFLVPVRIWR